LAYDINTLATPSNVVDAECNSITVGSIETPTVQAPAGSRTIFVDPCATPVSSFPYTNDFAGNALPSCWQNVDNDGSGQIWEFDNPAGRAFASTTNGNGFAILDSDNYGNGGTQDADMISPAFDFTNYTSINLSFEHYFYYWAGSSATLSYSIDGGTTWTEISSWATADEGSLATPAVFSQDLTAQLEGESNVKFKWNYIGSFGYYWAVDDIEVNASLAGTPYTVTFDVSDANDSSPIDAADILINSNTLITDVNGEATIDLIDGSYPYTVAKAGYDNATGTVVVAGSVVTESVSLNETTYTLTFAVVDEASQPVENASVSINSTTITTDVNGEATIDLVNGTYAYTVSKAGYDNATGSATISSSAVTENVTLIETTYTVTFTVTDAGDSQVLDGASISINSSTLTTDINGQATIDLPNGDYPYMVTNMGYDNVAGTVTVSDGGVSENVSMYSSNNTLTFVVLDESATAIEGASILINSTTLTTDVSGEATITLPNGTFAYTVSKTGYADGNGSVTMAGADVTENVTLYSTASTVTFNVTDGMNPLAGASIDINSTVILTDGTGTATINLPDGSYNYTVTYTGYDEVSGSVTVAGSAITENVTMNESAYTVTFIVQDEFANFVDGASISINSATLTTDASGQATIDLINGAYNYTVSKTGLANANGSLTVNGTTITENVTMYSSAYTITFNVTDSDAGTAIEGAAIEINSTTLLSDASGTASINLPDGNYAYSVTKAGFEGANGNVIVSGADVTENVSLTAIVPITFNTILTQVTCYGGTDGAIEFTDVTGGSGTGYEYSINGGATWQSGATFAGLAAGTFNAVVKDDAGALSDVQSVMITQPDQITGFTIQVQDVSVFGGNDGVIEVQGTTGGSGVYEYSLYSGTVVAPWQSSNVFSNLYAETYEVHIKDANGCEVVSDPVTVSEPGQQEYTVTFDVSVDGQPYEGATININSTVLTTNSNGLATISLADGTYDYTASVAGLDDIQGTVDVNGANVTETISFVGLSGAFANEINIYPNPVSSRLTIEVDGNYEVMLTNTIGEIILSQKMENKGIIEIDSYADGLYLLRIERNGRIVTRPVIIKK
jgi:hypothetical protein